MCIDYVYFDILINNLIISFFFYFFQYLEKRFGVTTRLIVSIAFCIQMVLYMGIVVHAPALALEAVTNIDHVYAVLLIGIVCTFYAGIGGMKAVLMTDVLQVIFHNKKKN